MKRVLTLLLLLLILITTATAEAVTASTIDCIFKFDEESAQIGNPFSFSYELLGGSGSYSNIEIEAEFVTIHGSSGNDVDIQFFEMGTQSSGIVTVTPLAGSALILWLRGKDTNTGEEFYFECHQEWIPVKQNPSINIVFQYDQEEAVIDQTLSLQYKIEGISGLSKAQIWWQIESEFSSGKRFEEQSISSLSGTTSIIPPYGEDIYAIIQGKDNLDAPFYAESEHLKLTNTETEDITCDFSFPNDNPRIGSPYTFSYMISGGSGSYSDIEVEAEFVTVHESRGNDVDIQLIELGENSASNVSFAPKAGSAVILWLSGKDAKTGQPFIFECHSGWLPVESNSSYPVTFTFEKEKHAKGENIKVDYQIKNLDTGLINGNLRWTLISDFKMEDGHNAIEIVDSHGSAEFTPAYGNAFYVILEGTDRAGNPIYAESEHMILDIPSDFYEEGVLLSEGTNLNTISPVKVPTMILPSYMPLSQSLILNFNKQSLNERQSVMYDVCLVDAEGDNIELLDECLLIFPYPEGLDTNSNSKYRIMIHHYGKKGTEVFSAEDDTIQLLPQGVCICVSSLSPFVIEWEELPEINLPQTGDNSYIVLWLALLILAGTTMLALKRKIA
ncbi:MAG: LPXTG cell wall anchor domain-containing protein [Clostridia bacterium]|nr:LPXTG cell wall anchor domain-containing protein [Clostridia bacterium]